MVPHELVARATWTNSAIGPSSRPGRSSFAFATNLSRATGARSAVAGAFSSSRAASPARHDLAALDRDERRLLGQQQPFLAGMDGQLETDTEQSKASHLLRRQPSARRRPGRCRDLTGTPDRARPRPALRQEWPSGDGSGSAAPCLRAPARPSPDAPIRSDRAPPNARASRRQARRHGPGARTSRASRGTPKRDIARSTKSLASAGEPSSVRTFSHSGATSLRLHRVLGETRAGFLLVFRGVAPPRLHDLRAVLEAQVERKLAGHASAQHHRRHQRVGHRPPFIGERNGHARRLADLLGLAKDDIEHGAVDRAVRREHHDRSDELCRLAEAVDPSLALLMPGRVPRQIVVDDRVEELLEVDAFGQAVGGDENALDLFAFVRLAPCRPRGRGVRRA